MNKLLENIIRKMVREELITPPNMPNTMTFWHGGNLDNYEYDTISQKSGRYKFGPGLYLITKYDEAIKYSKGSRKLYMVTVALGNDLEDVSINVDAVKEFIKKYTILSKRNDIMHAIDNNISEDNTIPAFIINNLIVNYEAIKPGNTKYLRQFYIDNSIDYSIVNNPFGWSGEKMMVLFNMRKILNVKRIMPGDKIEQYDL